jgi:hypothetical protein
MSRARLAVAVLCLPLLGCYEEPIRDHLHLAFGPGPVVIVTAVRDVAAPETAGDNTAVEDRMDEARAGLDRGWDRWSRSFAELDAIAERSTIERHDGEARRGVHSALLEEFRPLQRLLGLEGLTADLAAIAGVRELQLVPTGAGQATRQQREHVDRELDTWATAVAAYLEAATALYAYLDRAPERAIPCFAHVFDDHTDASGPLTEPEEKLVLAVKNATEQVADVLLIETGDAFSLNELSRLVFDSFQGRLTVAVDGPILEIEGFIDRGAFVERPPVDLWRALESIAGRWLVPDLVTAMVQPGPESAQPGIDSTSFAAAPRRWSPAPDAWTVESELRSRLRAADFYRVRWRAAPVPDDDELVDMALAQLASAEADLPD